MRILSAFAAGLLLAAAGGAAQAQEAITTRIGAMTWRGNAAQAPVEVTNTSGVPMRATAIGCDFIAIGRIVGSDRQSIPALAPGQSANVTVSSDTGGQLVDSIICRLQ